MGPPLALNGSPAGPYGAGDVPRYGRASRLLVVLLVGIGLLAFDFGARIFASNDEVRFPLLARDILDGGHWLLPRLNGVPHVDKPPLQAWLIALASWPGGAVTQASSALPSLLAALGVVLATTWIAAQLFGSDAAAMAGAVAVTTYGMLELARIPIPDMTLCATATGAIAAYLAALRRRTWLLAFYALVAAAVWTKGPVGLLPLAIALLDALRRFGRAGPRRLWSAGGLLLFVGLLVPWWLLAAAVTGAGRFWIDVVRNDWLLWYVPTGGWDWWTIPHAIGLAFTVLLPWAPLLPAALWWAARRPAAGTDRGPALPALWLACIFAVMALSHQQRLRYYLPLVPPAAVLLAGWWHSRRWQRRTALFAALWLISAAGLALEIQHAGNRANAETGLTTLAGDLPDRTAPVYALEVPELVFSFYLDRPVRLLRSAGDIGLHGLDDHGGYLVIADRVLPGAAGLGRPLAVGVVNRRPYSVFVVDPPSRR
jgi:4-amino-4-deoxy-L-arabinose transferase-like glycosyltransferase